MVAARALFQAQKYKEAAEAFRVITQKDPKNGEAWFDLGYSLHATGQLDEAITAHAKAAEFPDYRAAALYNLGCAHALQGSADKAFEALNASVDSGFNQLQVLQDDPDLKSLREDPRYALLVARLSPAKV
jgi:Flp pilus assembly protein TadD